jgi:dTDP-4-amino-4,6-dideoxy-D-galactose acyltransferase
MPHDVPVIDRWSAKHSITCLYFLAGTDDAATVRAAEDGGFRLVDVRITLGRGSIEPVPVTPSVDPLEIATRPSKADDLPILRQIASVSHDSTRFFFDPNFPRAKCALLYQRWIEKSCAGYANQVLVGEIGGMPAGYITCHLPSDSEQTGRIGLLAVAPTGRGHGLGKRLVRHALDWFAGQSVEAVSVVTQGRNVPAQALYQQCGFVTRSVFLWYHKWYVPLEGRVG